MKKIKSNKRKKFQKVNEKVLIVSVDIGKTSNTGYWRYPCGPESKVFSFGNNKRGFEFFLMRITAASRVCDAKKILVGFESTGSYSEPLVNYLCDKPVELVQVNPMHTKRWKDVNGNSRTKSDKKDPLVIADIIEMRNYLSVIVPKGASAHLRRLTHSRERTLDRRNVSINQLYDLVYLIFPEFLQVMKGLRSKSSFYLLDHYSSPDELIKLGYEELVLHLKKASRGKLGFERAVKLLEAAKNSVGIKEGRESIIKEIKKILKDIRGDDEFITKVEIDISKYLKDILYSRYILSIKGIGEITTAVLIGEVGDFEAIHNRYSLIKLAGLNLCENSSGKRRGQICISKQGRSLLRKILFFAAINVVRKGGIMHDYYQALIQRGMIKMKALVAVMRKVLKVIFALVREKKDYNVNYGIKLAA